MQVTHRAEFVGAKSCSNVGQALAITMNHYRCACISRVLCICAAKWGLGLQLATPLTTEVLLRDRTHMSDGYTT